MKRRKKIDRQALLDKYYDFIDNKNIIVKLHFNTFSELIDNNFGDNSVEKLNNILFDELEQCFKEIPRKLNIHLNVKIDDYGEYNPNEAEQIIKDNISLKMNTQKNLSRRTSLKGIFLVIIGAIILAFSYFLSQFNISQIYNDIINISGTLLVWEACYKVFIEKNEAAIYAFQYVFRLKSITIN